MLLNYEQVLLENWHGEGGRERENIQVVADKLFNTDWVLSYKLAQKSVMAKV